MTFILMAARSISPRFLMLFRCTNTWIRWELATIRLAGSDIDDGTSATRWLFVLHSLVRRLFVTNFCWFDCSSLYVSFVPYAWLMHVYVGTLETGEISRILTARLCYSLSNWTVSILSFDSRKWFVDNSVALTAMKGFFWLIDLVLLCLCSVMCWLLFGHAPKSILSFINLAGFFCFVFHTNGLCSTSFWFSFRGFKIFAWLDSLIFIRHRIVALCLWQAVFRRRHCSTIRFTGG